MLNYPNEIKWSPKGGGYGNIGNILFGGLIGILIVDPITGAMWTLPDELTVTLVKEDIELSKNEQGLKILTLAQLPKDFRDELIRIK